MVFISALVLFSGLISTPQAIADTQNPVVTPNSGEVSKQYIAAGGAATITVTYQITDDAACCNAHNAFIYNVGSSFNFKFNYQFI